MEFRYQYYGSTQVNDTAAEQAFSFAPDLLRPPTRFDGLLRRDGPAYLQVREGLSALHSVVVSDLRTRGRDKTAYREWLQEHEAQMLATFMADTGGAQARAKEISADELARAKKPRVDQIEKARETNSYWLSELAGAQTDPRRLEATRAIISGTERVSAADVQRAAQAVLKDENMWKLEVRPAAKK